ncbi:MAG: permease [Patescibacteria group bacterium]|nr:permease [Patescibacteria group bacterium]
MEILIQFFRTFWHYLIEILPALVVGFLISGFVHEFISRKWIGKSLSKKGTKSIFYATLVGMALPICCDGVLPVALSFYKKGAKLGAILAFLVVTPATSIPAMLITYKLLGLEFAIFLALAVILLGLIVGVIGSLFSVNPKKIERICEKCTLPIEKCICPQPAFPSRIKSAFKFAFREMPKEIGLELMIGLGLASLIMIIVPFGDLIRTYLAGAGGYAFAAVFGVLMYICATASVPMVQALLIKGMNVGAAMTLLLVGPITSFSTLLVIRKIFGSKILLVYLTVVLVVALLAGYTFSFF